MPLPQLVWRETPRLYANAENILGMDFKVFYTGPAPTLTFTNDDGTTYEQVSIGASGALTTHTFSSTGQIFKSKIIFFRPNTTITKIEYLGDASMTASLSILQDGLKIVLDRTFDSSPTRTFPNQGQIGEGTTAVTINDTTLTTLRPIQNIDILDKMEVTTGWTASGTNTVAINSTTFVRGVAAVNLVKSDTSSVDAYMEKSTLTAQDLTSQTLFTFVRIDAALLATMAATDALTFRVGSDASNYYVFTKDASELTGNFFNRIEFTIAGADSTTGTPVNTAIDYVRVQMTTQNIADVTTDADSFVVDEIFFYETDDTDKTQESTYPSIDFATLQVELRHRINTIEANGFLISEISYSNKDATVLLFAKAVLTALSKGASDEFIFSAIIQAIQGAATS